MNEVARAVLKELINKYKTAFVTTNWVRNETLSRLKQQSIDSCYAFEKLLAEASVLVVHIDNSIETKALELFWSYKDKKWSVVDCASIVVARDNGSYYVFSADRHFTEASLFSLIEYEDSTGEPRKTYADLIFY